MRVFVDFPKLRKAGSTPPDCLRCDGRDASDRRQSGGVRRAQDKGKASLEVPIIASVTSQSREILTGSTKYQGIGGYFCENVFKYCFRDSHLRTTKLSRPGVGIFASTGLIHIYQNVSSLVNVNVHVLVVQVVSSIRQRSSNRLSLMLWLLQLYGVSRFHSTSQPFSEHYRQADFNMLVLRVVTARVHVVLSRSFTSLIK